MTHLVIFLDEKLNQPGKYPNLKKVLASNMNPRVETYTMLIDPDHDDLIHFGHATPVKIESDECFFQAFDNVDTCLKAFVKNKDKRIFFITTETMGKDIVPKILADYRQLFTDPVKNEPYNSIYILCGEIMNCYDWAIEYIGYLQMFNFDAKLLAKMARDIANYYITEGNRLFDNGQLEDALIYCHWAKIFCIRETNIEGTTSTSMLHAAESLSKKVEEEKLQQFRSDNHSDEKAAEIESSSAFTSQHHIKPVVYVVSYKSIEMDLDSDIVDLKTFSASDQLVYTLLQRNLKRPCYIFSHKVPSVELVSHSHLIRYYCLEALKKHNPTCSNVHELVTSVDSVDDFISELYDDLGDYYTDQAEQALIKHHNRAEAKYLLVKANKCFELVDTVIDKTMNCYNNILSTQNMAIDQSVDRMDESK